MHVWADRKCSSANGVVTYHLTHPTAQASRFRSQMAALATKVRKAFDPARVQIAITRSGQDSWVTHDLWKTLFGTVHVVDSVKADQAFFNPELHRFSRPNDLLDSLPRSVASSHFDLPAGVGTLDSVQNTRHIINTVYHEQWKSHGLASISPTIRSPVPEITRSYATADYMRLLDQCRSPFIDGSKSTAYSGNKVYALTGGRLVGEFSPDFNGDRIFQKIWNESVQHEAERFQNASLAR